MFVETARMVNPKFSKEKRGAVGILRRGEFMVHDCVEILACGDLFYYFIADGQWGCSGMTVVVRRT